MSGPLSGIRVVELGGIGPAPFCGMVLADLGADVIRVDRANAAASRVLPLPEHDVLNRGKRSLAADLKTEDGVAVALDLIASADALIEGFRPGVTEKLGLGPAQCLTRNQTLVYGRMTGWGQEGPLAAMAGHDIDYIAVSGALHSIGNEDEPFPPLNLVGDFGGGGMLLLTGVLAALLNARESGEGQVVDAAMVDGSALLMASHHGFAAEGWWDGTARSSNLLDGAAPFYTTYEASDGGRVAVGALEPQFFAELVGKLGLDPAELPAQLDREGWPTMREAFASRFSERTRDEWSEHFEGSDACVAPVLSMSEAPDHRYNRARSTFTELEGIVQPAPAPRFSATPASVEGTPCSPGEHTDRILADLGYSPERIVMLRGSGAIS